MNTIETLEHSLDHYLIPDEEHTRGEEAARFIVQLHDQSLSYVKTTGYWLVEGYVSTTIRAFSADRRQFVRTLSREYMDSPYTAACRLIERAYPAKVGTREVHHLALTVLSLSDVAV